MTTWTTQVTEDPDTGDAVIIIPEEILENLGYQVGDELCWELGDNQIIIFIISKKLNDTLGD